MFVPLCFLRGRVYEKLDEKWKTFALRVYVFRIYWMRVFVLIEFCPEFRPLRSYFSEESVCRDKFSNEKILEWMTRKSGSKEFSEF
ncbi:hypothetical protein A0128_02025 [Leptospira tipperaryensis]|uniref:Uncharacterized protein n=1 Tax=Leptospira tipperaryensis TaxID=2564040 RepID=A0A1D7UT69_9LEPT|nr:hypothetical protein A0128_02025 [Leptospira tipperaryensis]